jgi:hypothetical protein
MLSVGADFVECWHRLIVGIDCVVLAQTDVSGCSFGQLCCHFGG